MHGWRLGKRLGPKCMVYSVVPYLDTNGFEELRMSKGQLHHLFNLCQLLTTTSDVIIANFIQSILLLLRPSPQMTSASYLTEHNVLLNTTCSGHWMVTTVHNIIIIIKAICNAQDPSRRPQMRCPAVRKCSCLYTMYHINNNVFSCVLKVVRYSQTFVTWWASYSTQKVWKQLLSP